MGHYFLETQYLKDSIVSGLGLTVLRALTHFWTKLLLILKKNSLMIVCESNYVKKNVYHRSNNIPEFYSENLN